MSMFKRSTDVHAWLWSDEHKYQNVTYLVFYPSIQIVFTHIYCFIQEWFVFIPAYTRIKQSVISWRRIKILPLPVGYSIFFIRTTIFWFLIFFKIQRPADVCKLNPPAKQHRFVFDYLEFKLYFGSDSKKLLLFFDEIIPYASESTINWTGLFLLMISWFHFSLSKDRQICLTNRLGSGVGEIGWHNSQGPLIIFIVINNNTNNNNNNNNINNR